MAEERWLSSPTEQRETGEAKPNENRYLAKSDANNADKPL
jgi:hypothetical protein